MQDPMIGPGGAPTRATTLPSIAVEKKTFPVASGFLDYFPDAVVAVSHVSYVANQQHNPGQPVHWARSKSGDEVDAMIRHVLQRGTLDNDGLRHSAKLAWRAMALLQKEIESERETMEDIVNRFNDVQIEAMLQAVHPPIVVVEGLPSGVTLEPGQAVHLLELAPGEKFLCTDDEIAFWDAFETELLATMERSKRQRG